MTNRAIPVVSLCIALASLAVCSVLIGCTLTLPVRLEKVEVHEEVLQEDRSRPPQMTLALHPDGLGWQISVVQRVNRRVTVGGEEYLRYRLYDLSGKSSSGRSENYDDLCALAMLTTPLFALFDLDHPPYWATWDRLIAGCQRAADTPGSVTRLYGKRRFRDHLDISVEAVTDGHLALSWKSENREPVQVLIPLRTSTKDQGIPVRLRWLAESMRRKGHDPGLERFGLVELQLIRQGQPIVRKTLPVTSDDLVASLKDDRNVSAAAEHWPHPLVMRIERDPLLLSQSERGHLVNQAALALNRLSIPVVVRGPELEELRAEQARAHQPAFVETPVQDPARMVGATVLLHLEVHAPYSRARRLILTLIEVSSGEILAKVTAEGHDSQWPFTVDTAMMQLETTLQQVLDHLRLAKLDEERS